MSPLQSKTEPQLRGVHAVTLWLALTGVGCTSEAGPVVERQARSVMGTFAEVTAVASHRPAARRAVEAAYERLERVNALMSDYVSDSEVGRLNALAPREPLALTAETFEVLSRAAEFARASGGAFDVTCRPLVRLWRRCAKEDRVPTDAELRVTLERVGWDKLTLDPATRSATPTVAGLKIDLGAIAKGYALDLASAAMRAAGATAGLVNVGGDVVAVGHQSTGQPWRIGVRHPFRNGLFDQLAIADRGVATSGLQQRFTIIQGKRYSHIVDPRSGHPAAEAPSVSVIATDGITADAWATTFSVLDVEEGRRLAAQLRDVEVLWIWRDEGKLRSAETTGFAAYRTRR